MQSGAIMFSVEELRVDPPLPPRLRQKQYCGDTWQMPDGKWQTVERRIPKILAISSNEGGWNFFGLIWFNLV